MSLPDPTFASFGDDKIAYYSYGAGARAVVFIHGWTCDSALWLHQQPLFAKYKRTVLVDYVGHGNSDAPEIDYATETLARSVKAALDHAGVRKAVVIGHSMGGPVTTTLTRLFPDLIKGIIYVDSFFRLPEDYFTSVELADVRQRNSSNEKFEGFVRWMLSVCSQDVTAKVVQRMLSTPKHVRVSATGTPSRPPAFRYDEVYDIAALHISTVFASQIDPFWRHHFPQMELRVDEWKDCSHFPFMDQPERFNETVEEWIKEKGLM